MSGDTLLVERSFTGRSWRLLEPDAGAALALAQRLELPEIVARILALRSIDRRQAESFLQPRLRDWLPDPSHLQDLDRAAARIAEAIGRGERIGIIGDYDVDGATSTALMARYLRHFACPFEVVIPHRLNEGYGPSVAAVDKLAAAGCKLILTLDSGTTAHAPLAHAKAAGLEVIVVDHHSPEAALPAVLALVNPNRLDQESPLGDLAAVGVTFMLTIALNRLLRADREVPDLMAWLDLVALGTVCDVVPLHGLNRAFVHQGLRVAATGSNPGMAALGRAAGVALVDDSRQLGFAFGPRINAGGRLGHSQLGWRLLTCDDAEEAASIATTLDDLNRQRQTLERQCLGAAQRSVEAQAEADWPILVAAGEGWHVGVIGIVASRLVETFERPVFVIGLDGDVGKGSARSVDGIDIGAMVHEAKRQGLLLEGGGHPMAAGVTLARDQLEAFQAHLQEAAATAMPDGPRRQPLCADAMLSPGAINLELIDKLDRLAPFGAGNAEPLLAVRDARIMRPREVGTGHVACLIGGPAGGAVKAIAFRAARSGLDRVLMGEAGNVMLLGRLRRDTYGGTPRPSFEIEDAAPPATV